MKDKEKLARQLLEMEPISSELESRYRKELEAMLEEEPSLASLREHFGPTKSVTQRVARKVDDHDLGDEAVPIDHVVRHVEEKGQVK